MGSFCWLASYPKSGNTWLRLLLWSVLNGGKSVDFSQPITFSPSAAARVFFEDMLPLESSELSQRELRRLRPFAYLAEAGASSGRLYRKTHEVWSPGDGDLLPLFPPAVTAKVVYVLRDPRDVVLSWAHHRGESVDVTIDFMNNPEARTGDPSDFQFRQHLSSWSAHVVSWLETSDRAPLLVRYENLQNNPLSELARVVEFLELDVASNVLAAAVVATRFERLVASEQTHGFIERLPHMDRFFRQGIAGGWRSALTSAQVARIESDHADVMLRYGYF